ncbi:MAG: ECF transporter S component [Clostridia bacterium]|nr:ECF transporter S component [Clostridia bacterium]
MKNQKTLELVQLSLFSAIIILLAATPSLGYIPIGVTRATIIHIPVILGSLVLGPKKGAILGAIFGLTSLLKSTFEPTVTSFAFSPFYSAGDVHGNFFSLVICFVPRILVGIVPYYVNKLMKSVLKDIKGCETISLAVSGILGSMTNTLLVLHFIYIFFGANYASVMKVSVDALYGAILSIIVTNGIPEAIVASVLTAAVGKALLHFKAKKYD